MSGWHVAAGKMGGCSAWDRVAMTVRPWELHCTGVGAPRQGRCRGTGSALADKVWLAPRPLGLQADAPEGSLSGLRRFLLLTIGSIILSCPKT